MDKWGATWVGFIGRFIFIFSFFGLVKFVWWSGVGYVAVLQPFKTPNNYTFFKKMKN